MSSPNAPTAQQPYLMPLASAAEMVGLSPRMFEAAVNNGDLLGVQILLLGARGLRYVIASRVVDWMERQDARPSIEKGAAK